MNIIEFYKTNTVDDNFDDISYQKKYPETKDFYQPFCKENNITEKQRLFFHYSLYVKSKEILKQSYYSNENLVTDRKGCHVFNYEYCDVNTDVFHRQNKALNSYSVHKHPNVEIYNISKTNVLYNNIIDFNLTSYNTFECENREYYYLNDLVSFASTNVGDDDYIIFTNSDCYIDDTFYEFILGSSYNYIEFFRTEVNSNSIVGQNKDGIDGFAIKKSVYLSLKEQKIIPDNLIIGSPYWDAVISNLARKHIKKIYQDTKRLKHTQHKQRWSFANLDEAGKNNLSILNNLYENNIIDCRKAEILCDNLIVKLFNDSTNYDIVKPIIVNERFGSDLSINFEYNYLFIETYSEHKRLNDNAIGTTAGTRIHIKQSDNSSKQIQQIIKQYQNIYQRLSIVNQYDTVSDDVIWQYRTINHSKLGIILCFFGDDINRINAVKYSIDQLSRQTAWAESLVVFVELLPENSVSNFELTQYANVKHIQIIQQEKNRNLFQKECLWNIGAKFLQDLVDNYIFIDADTFPQNTNVFAKANRILQYNPDIVYQLGDYLITKKDNNITRIQMLWNFFSTLQAKNSYCFNPCGGFAISKTVFNQINGFNPYGFLYGGDILFLYEIDNRSHTIYDSFIHDMKIFKNSLRQIKNDNIILKNDNQPLIHVWHGDHIQRPYHLWGQKFNSFDFDLHRDIVLGNNGLLEWRSEHTPENLIIFFANRHKNQ